MRSFDMMNRVALLVIAAAMCLATTGCASNASPTDAERLARGREIVERMSAKLAAAPSFSVTTEERREQVKSDGTTAQIALVRQTVMRRPDRLHFTTTGDVAYEGWYDGVGLTLALHDQKVFGQARMPETLDRALDAIHERYDVQMPLGDFLYSSPARALIADTTTGGWVGRETLDGQPVEHLAFKDRGVEWELWIPAEGDPVPLKGAGRFPGGKRLRAIQVAFRDWNFAPAIAGDRFTPKVGTDYEGIALIQRASILRHIPDDAAAKPPTK
jgi:hypothetical protein